MSDSGWVKIHRNIFKNPWMNDADVLGTWVYILLNVAYQPTDVVFEGKRITLKAGQGLFKIRQMAKILGVSNSKLHRIISLFKSETQIETQTTPRNTLITVINWDKYQSAETQNETQVEHKWNTDETQVNHLPIKERNKEYKNKRNINNTNVLFVDLETDKPENECQNEYQKIIDEWNKLPLPSVSRLGGKRLDMLKARIKEYSVDDVISAIRKIRESPWLLGNNRQGWQATFDWFIRPNNFPKVLEGNYIGAQSQKYDPFSKNDAVSGYQKTMNMMKGMVEDEQG